jgi:alkylation response protein AidB-like acyl-CoA dehydrogenase
LVALARRTPQAPAATVDDVVRAWMDADAYRLYVQSTALEALSGKPIGAESSANKLFWSQLDVRIHETALRLLGPRATLTDDPDASWLDGYLFALAGPIYAGTNEVQRNVVAERVLGLPR